MNTFEYTESPYPVRENIVAANRLAWDRIAGPGNWWTGEERIVIAEAVRKAADCGLCSARQSGNSAEGTPGEHDHAGMLPIRAIEAIHRLANEPAQLDRKWYEGLLDDDFTDAHYVEIVGIAVTVVCIDAFHRALKLPLEPLPKPKPGTPTFYRPHTAVLSDQAWVPMITKSASVGTAEEDLYPGAHTGNVLMAMSLVPDAVRLLNDTHTAHYVDFARVGFAGPSDWELSRPQIELIAARVSVLNHCFY